MKKSIFTLFFIFFAIFLCGCTPKEELPEKLYEKNAIRIIREIGQDDKIKMTYAFGLNSESFKAFGLLENELKIYKFYFASYLNALAKQYKDKSIEGSTVSSCVYFSDIDAFGFSITFENQKAQSGFYDTKDNEQSGFVLQRHFFTNVYSLKTSFPISTSTLAESFLLPAKLALQETSKESNVSKSVLQNCINFLNETIFIYDFSTSEASLKSESVYFDGEKEHNFFVKKQSEIENPIEFYYVVPNRAVWYICALVFVLASVFISLFVLGRKKIRHL